MQSPGRKLDGRGCFSNLAEERGLLGLTGRTRGGGGTVERWSWLEAARYSAETQWKWRILKEAPKGTHVCVCGVVGVGRSSGLNCYLRDEAMGPERGRVKVMQPGDRALALIELESRC